MESRVINVGAGSRASLRACGPACALGHCVWPVRARIGSSNNAARRLTCGLPPTARRSHQARALPGGESTTTVLEAPPATPRTHMLGEQGSHASYGDDDDEDLDLQHGQEHQQRLEVAFVSLVDGKYTVRGRLLLRAPASEAYELLTDYAGCHRVFSNIAASDVVVGPDGGKRVEQVCRWRFLAFSGTFKVQLGVVEDDAARTLLFNLVHSNFMSDFEGRWAVAPAAAPPGAPPGEQWCEVQHTLAVVPAVQVPAPVAGYTRFIFVKQVEGILLDLQRGLPRWRAERS